MRKLGDEAGLSMVGLMILLPAYLLLLTGMIGAYGTFSRNYIRLESQWACLEEVRNIMNSLGDNLRYATTIDTQGTDEVRLTHYTTEGQVVTDRYSFAGRSGEGGVIYLNSQPLSNLDRQGYVKIWELTFQKLSPWKLQVHLVVGNRITGRSITVDRVLFSHCGWRMEQDNEVGNGDEG